LLQQSRTHYGTVPGTWALSPLVGTPWRVWTETVEYFIKTMNTKNYIISDKTTAQEIVSGVRGLRYGW